MPRQALRTVLCAIVLMAAGIPPASAGSIKVSADKDWSPLAVIDGKALTLQVFQEEMKRRPGVYGSERGKELLQSLVQSELLFAAAKRAGYENDPEVIRAVKQVVIGKYLRDNIEKAQARVEASEQELQSYYEANRSRFGIPASVHAAVIRIAVSPKAGEKKRAELLQRAEAARKEALALEAGVPAFGSIAVNYSDDQDSRYRGGDIGWLQKGSADLSLDTKVAEAIFSLQSPRQVSPVIDAADGYYIIKLIEKKEATFKKFAEVKEGVRFLLLQEKKARIERDFVEQLKRRIPVSVNSLLLQKIVASDRQPEEVPPSLPER